MTPPRVPQGYVGTGHETRGADIVAILQVLHLPEATLGPELAARIAQMKPGDWYPIEHLLAVLEHLDKRVGAYGLRQVGWSIFAGNFAEETKKHFQTAQALLHAFDGLYHQSNRGNRIGGWKVTKFDETGAVLENTTPHHCGMEQGILEEALRTVGVSAAVSQSECFRQGAPLCRFVISPNPGSRHWM